MFVNQSIQRPHGINVFGSCLLRVEPDYASLRFTVSRTAGEPRRAIEEAREGVARVRAILQQRGVADRDVQSSRVGLALAFEGYGEARRTIGYRAAHAFQALVRELCGIEELLIELVDAGAFEIESVSYKTSRLRELRASARRGAIASARSKAELYAEALGLRLGRALHVEDVNPDDLARRSHMPDVDLAAHDESESAAVSRGSIVVAAAAMVCFSITT